MVETIFSPPFSFDVFQEYLDKLIVNTHVFQEYHDKLIVNTHRAVETL